MTRPRPTLDPARARWAGWLLAAQVVFQLLVAGLAYLQRDDFIARITGSALAPNHNAAVGAFQGSLLVHLLLAVLFTVGALRIRRGHRSARIWVSIPLTITTVVGIAALWLPVQTWLSPVGVVLAVAALLVLWLPVRDTRVGQ